MYLCKCLLEFGDDIDNSHTMVSYELCHVGWNEPKGGVKQTRFYTTSLYYSPRNERIFCCFDCARDLIFHSNIKKIFSNF